ncbi:carbon storage regulator CsrA [Microbulbifer sp. 2304DJ12-6]|uniref:carbon storage regulator CsrA n=1 Tax=Microbulbifer sp. 2304DJ12-6 TaxID=3233340 RepID=UPI0039AF0C4B
MLILKRRPGENLRIGKNVSVIVLEITGNQVRVGIKAPKSLPVHREEVYLRIQKERARDNGKSLAVASPRGEGLP